MRRTSLRTLHQAVTSVCGRDARRLVPLTGGGMNETYRVDLRGGIAVVARVARGPGRWFTDEAAIISRVRAAGVPTPEVLGVEHIQHDDEVLSVAILGFLPGRALDTLAGELAAADLKRLVMDSGELLARIHGCAPDRGIHHGPLGHAGVDRAVQIVAQQLGGHAARIVERGADFQREQATRRPCAAIALAHGDFMPKNLIVDSGPIVGVIDWEFAGPGPPAVDVGRWEVSAGPPWDDRLDLLTRGYARIADPERALDGWLPALAVAWAMEQLGWANPAPTAQIRRCLHVIARYAG